MPDLPKKYEDWTPPWKEGEFDADKAGKLIFDLHHDKAKLQVSNQTLTTERDDVAGKLSASEAQVAELQDKDLPEIDRLRKENERLRVVPPKVEKTSGGDDVALVTARFEAAMNYGMTTAQAKRLVGSTPEEIAEDAKTYAQEHGLTENGENGGNERPPSGRPQGKLRTGLGGEITDPDEFDPAKQTLPPRN